MSAKTEKIAQSTRFYRKIHKWISIPLFVFMFLIGFTGLLLGWKKNIGLLPSTKMGSNVEVKAWVSLDSIQASAQRFAKDSLGLSTEIDRIDVRPQKGVAKIVFIQNFTELQVDCATGKVVSIATRKSDIIEKIHDGSILDFFIKTPNDEIKLFYTTILALGLILLSFSGFWLWYNPKRIKKQKAL
ncbi:PepSY-associated TM helix domain protein [Emticicia oligotrophica DSM 17448]|uniref:PepSY-associated TM helix domain protein n=1 Tax=Emticicia oligotrophica (strain DSM 17448 / CIP 109782 / MTCC 6937 / GPTSA100-15) TaxID=929562 RepID=A0ABM5N1Z9_EMTOG|nr:PepSY-associated TM helix domain-containing protein [Emticicia oligotrophica]AFK03345.1 PepSY-associated TM helix domain protein [Emticicia oligotrophica DSM 17448]